MERKERVGGICPLAKTSTGTNVPKYVLLSLSSYSSSCFGPLNSVCDIKPSLSWSSCRKMSATSALWESSSVAVTPSSASCFRINDDT